MSKSYSAVSKATIRGENINSKFVKRLTNFFFSSDCSFVNCLINVCLLPKRHVRIIFTRGVKVVGGWANMCSRVISKVYTQNYSNDIRPL